jgi:LysR family transcriptional regulator of gallate degradation
VNDDLDLTDAEAFARQLKRLRCVAAVAAHGSAARAAEALHQSQPAVTRAIQGLEAKLHLRLFDRGSRGMVPTPAGRLLAARVRRAVEQLERGSREATYLTSIARATPKSASRLATMVSGRLLYVLIAVAETGSEGRAAERLALSQPAISQCISELEHLARTQLLERTTRGVRLTEPGEALLRRAKLALAELRVGQEEVASFRGQLRGRVVLGALPLSSSFLIPRAVTKLLDLHPEVHVTIVDGTYESLLYQLQCADVDVIVGALRQASGRDIEQEPLFNDALSVIARVDHPAEDCHALADLVDMPWIVPLPNTPGRGAFERAFQAEGVALPSIRLQVNSPSVVRSLLQNSDRLSLLSPLQVQAEVRAGLLRVLSIPLQGTQRTIGLATRSDGAPSPSLIALRQQLRAASELMSAISILQG